VSVSIPLSLVTEDLFVGLYEAGLTASDAEIACGIVFGVRRKRVIERAAGAMVRGSSSRK
jgi:hypothetical protein